MEYPKLNFIEAFPVEFKGQNAICLRDPQNLSGKMVNESTLKWVKERDYLSLSFTESIDAEKFYSSIEKEKNKRKICGLSPIYATLKTINAEKGKILDYAQAIEPESSSVVSYASVAFYF